MQSLLARSTLLLALVSAPCLAQQRASRLLTPAWVEVGDDGAAIARIVVSSPGDCPSLRIDGAARPMILREPTPQAFRPACELAIPPDAKSVSLGKQKLRLPRPDPARVIAIGDTGCRIKNANIQNCNDPSAWPFRKIATRAAAEKSDLVIHVGDYLYRESACPAGANALCGGTPAGDNWEAWKADFFAPAAKLLAAAPWAFSRGNHEDCLRSWRGFFYYLDPHPWAGTCAQYPPPYVIKLGSFELAMMDSSPVKEESLDEAQVTRYVAQLSSLHVENAWVVDHHPFWAFNPVGAITALPLSVPLEEAWNRTQPKGFDLILSGHIHLFEFISMDRSRPPQLVVGDGGTNMDDRLQPGLDGIAIRGATVVATASQHQFGYTVFTRKDGSWQFTLKNLSGHPLLHCTIPGGAASCKPAPQP